MIHAALVSCAALVLALAGVPGPSATPFAIGTFEPVPQGTPAAPFPNIGRVRSVTAACGVLRELAIPSFTAARRADAKFAETAKRLPDYASIVADPEHRTDVYREAALSRLDSDATALLGEAVTISRALGDPRLSRYSKDADVLAEREALQRIYDAQASRANLLEQFVIRQRVAIAKNGLDDSNAFGDSRSQAAATSGVPYAPDPAAIPARDMPKLTGIGMTDRKTLANWSLAIAGDVRESENAGAKTFLPLMTRCGVTLSEP